MKHLLKTGTAALAAAILLAGCATSTTDGPHYEPKAKFNDFTDVTWLPETSVRAPYNAKEVAVDAMTALKAGIHVFYGTHDTRFALTNESGVERITENAAASSEGAVSWGAGADTLYRNGLAVSNGGASSIEPLTDGRILIRSAGQTDMFVAFALKAYDVSGLPVRQFLRDGNNRPSRLAWFVKRSAVFPAGSIAYQTTWWLGDDEVVTPSKSAFTGTRSFEELTRRYSSRLPYCLAYINHQAANPYGVVFDPVKQPRRRTLAVGMTGTFQLQPVKRSVFCERDADSIRMLTGQAAGTWTLKKIRGTLVMELTTGSEVDSSDLGVQPVNRNATSVGFAEIRTPRASKTGKKAGAVQYDTRVVPVRILKANEPITDFRLRFNDTAAATVRSALAEADASEQYWKKTNGQ